VRPSAPDGGPGDHGKAANAVVDKLHDALLVPKPAKPIASSGNASVSNHLGLTHRVSQGSDTWT
jgi:hypothetical protein